MSDTTTTLLDLAAAYFQADRAVLSEEQDLFDALGIDSLKALELMSEVEIEFDVEIPDYELQSVRTFAELASKIDERR